MFHLAKIPRIKLKMPRNITGMLIPCAVNKQQTRASCPFFQCFLAILLQILLFDFGEYSENAYQQYFTHNTFTVLH